MTKKDIFNHIDKSISENEFNEIKVLYKFYHRLFWCYKAAYKSFNRKNLSLTIVSTSLVAIGTIVGCVILNPIVLGTIAGSGTLVAVFQKKKNYEAKIKMSKYAFQLYDKVLNGLRSCLRGEKYKHKEFIHEMKIIDEIIIDFAPIIDKYKKQYDTKFK